MKLYTVLFTGLILYGCTSDYDPIGNNKPATKLKVSSKYLSTGGAGGTVTTKIVTNAPELAVGNAPDWVQSAVVNDDLTELNVTVTANDAHQIRSGLLKLSTVTDDTESEITLFLIQAGQNASIIYDSFTGETLGSEWTATDKTKIHTGTGVLVIDGAANGIGNSLYRQDAAGLVAQSSAGGVGNVVTAHVDVRTDLNHEGGLKTYYNPVNGDEFRFFFTMNTETHGSFYAFRFINNNQQPMALGDAIPSAGLPPVPPIGERDEYMRIEFTNVPRLPNWWQSEVNIYSLKTVDGKTEILQKHFSRKFEIDGPKPLPGYFGIWGRFPSVTFKNFTISSQKN
ncbi:MAG: hypothetical protein LBD53_11005 [Tannerella sp.]|nr:hypothetical protein [Tannerella sp.]